MSKKLPKYAKEFKDHKVIKILEDGSMEHAQIYNIDSATIETEYEMLPLKDAVKFYDRTNGGFTFVFNLDLPAKVASEELKELRRSNVIKNMMNYDREKPLDIMKLVPYIIAVVAIMF